MGETVVTLEDLLRPGLRAVVVGINPSPVSVEAGHYYQGRLGQLFFGRLREAGVLDLSGDGFEDDQAFRQSIGFTDAVKRPTPRATDLRPGELQHGRQLLGERLASVSPQRVLFTYKKAATTLLGPFAGHGLLVARPLGSAQVFVMPGPMEERRRVCKALHDLAAWWST
jgi:TDG/mug DNA glycosylase family protein